MYFFLNPSLIGFSYFHLGSHNYFLSDYLLSSFQSFWRISYIPLPLLRIKREISYIRRSTPLYPSLSRSFSLFLSFSFSFSPPPPIWCSFGPSSFLLLHCPTPPPCVYFLINFFPDISRLQAYRHGFGSDTIQKNLQIVVNAKLSKIEHTSEDK